MMEQRPKAVPFKNSHVLIMASNISDLSSLHDFTGLNEWDLTDIQKKIRDVYDLDISDIESGNLLEIFKRIHNKLYGAPSL